MFYFFFFNDTATTEIYTLSLHDALPISVLSWPSHNAMTVMSTPDCSMKVPRSEEHTSELQSRLHLVCRLLLEKKTEMQALLLVQNNRMYDSLEQYPRCMQLYRLLRLPCT